MARELVDVDARLARLDGRRLLTGQLGAIAALLVASTVGQLLLRLESLDRRPFRGLLYLFYVDGEFRIPALYSSLVLLACAVALGVQARRAHGDRDRDRWYWSGLAALFVALGTDEALAFHERSIHPLRDALGIEGGILYYTWVLPAVVLLVPAAIGLVPFLRRLPATTATRLVIAVGVLVAGAVGVEAAAGALEAAIGVDAATRHPGTIALVTIEEGLEMVGAALFLVAVVDHLRRGAAPAT